MLLDTPRISSRLDLLYLVTREFNAGLEIDQVLQNVLSATVASVGASDASLFLVSPDGKLENSLSISGFKTQQLSPDMLEAIFKHGLENWVWHNKKAALIEDTETDDRWYKDALTPDIAQARSAVSVPIQQSPQEVIGVLTITATKPNYFDDSDLAMLTIIADQAAFAFVNARLFKAEQHRRKLADTLISITHKINATLNLKEVLDLILEQLALVIDYDTSSVLLYDESNQILAVQAARGFEDMEDALNVKLTFDENIPNYRAILQKTPLVIGNVDNEPYWQKSSSSEQVKSWIGAPLIARDQVVGILTVDSFENEKYTRENVEIVAAFADQAATAVANAQTVTMLQNAEASYSALFEDSTDMILITDYEGDIVAVNRTACQLMRRPKDAVIGLNVGFITPKLKQFLDKNTHQFKAWRNASLEIEITDAYRQMVPLEVKVRHIQFGDKERVEWVGRDISARREMERMRQDLVNMLVHDLRGPIGNLINTVDLVAMMLPDTPENANLKKFLHMSKRTGRTLTDLVDSMLDVSRLEQGEVPLQRSTTSLEELTQEVKEQVTPQAAAKQTKLIVSPIPNGLSQVWIDNSLIRRVLVNLAGNAIKYAPDEASVWITTTIENNKIHFSVKDNGPGISKKNQTSIFNKFSRITGAVEDKPGVGLGLAFCKLATEAHGGTISVESNGTPGEGCTFHVFIPIIEEPQ